MKNKLGRIVSVLLLLALAVPFAACGETRNNEDATKAQGGTTEEPVPEVTADPLDLDDIPEGTDFEKAQIDIIERGSSERFWTDFYAEDFTGDIVRDEVYKRELRVEDRLNVVINVSLETTVTTNGAHGPWKALQKDIDSGVCPYEVAVGSNYNAQVEAASGRLYNLSKIKSLNFEKNYWAKYVNENMKIGGAMYTATGDITTFLYDSLYVIFFNRILCDSFGIRASDIYGYVRNKEWTLDKLIELTKDIYVSKDGSEIKQDGDTFGLGLIVTSATDSLFSACNIDLIRENSKGELEFVADLDKLDNVVRKMRDTLWSVKGWQPMSENTNYATDTTPLRTTQFSNDQLCFITDRLYMIKDDTMRNMKSDYGILPFPKYNDEQENYGTYVHDQFAVVAIPFSVDSDDLETIGTVLEALASDGRKYIKPMYYNVALTSRYARDAESVEMLDVIFNNIRMDKGFVFNNAMGSFTQKLMRDQIWKNQTTLASDFASVQNAIKASIKSLTKSFSKYANR